MNNKSKQTESKRWVLLEHLPFRYSKRILLIVFLYSLAFTLLLVGLRMFCHNLTTAISQDAQNAQNIQQNIADNIIRLHVIANSDTEEDQTLKLKVRDEVLSQIQDSLMQANTPAVAGHILENEQQLIHDIAAAKIRAEGYDYTVRVVMEQRYFPAKTYGDLTFPPGTYQALCIEIGEAEGKNWWCVLFPSLCFVDETTAEVPEDSKEKLENSLSQEAYDSLSNQSTPAPTHTAKPEFRSAIYDWIAGK
ncbi:MAG: stage II sporulation protein R [Eubacteriales bacterium]|nr:stage II sporulation protein R [Eubacteriales bacterium]